MDVLLFGDQTGLSFDILNDALRQTQGLPIVRLFLADAARILRREVAELPRIEREFIPEFSTFHELVQRYQPKNQAHPAIDASLTCLCQFLQFFAHYHDASLPFPVDQSRIVGLCVGSLTAAAVVSSSSISSLLPLAVETVGVAFRVGQHAYDKARLLSPAYLDDSEPWSYLVHGLDKLQVEIAIEDYQRENEVPRASLPYVSAVGPSTITLTGIPTHLHGLFQGSNAFASVVKRPLRIHAPYHSLLLYQRSEFRRIVIGGQRRTTEILTQRFPRLIQLHSLSEDIGHIETTLDLYIRTCQYIFADTLRLDLTVAKVASDVAGAGPSNVSVAAFGSTDAAKPLVSALQARNLGQVSVHDHSSPKVAAQNSSALNGSSAGAKIAVVGMAGRFPGGSNVEEFWQVLEQGLDVHKEVPKDRFDASAHVDADGKKHNTSHTPFGCFIDNPGLFDCRFFNMSPREAAQTDPMQRLALVTAYEALEQAGFVADRTPSSALDRVGTFYGQTSDDYREINAAQAIDTYFITGGIRAFGPGRINYHFKFRGPSYNIDTACSSSLAAIQLACTSLWSGDCDTAVAGGLSILTSPDLYAGLSRGQFLSKTGSCKTFDNAADGYCRGDSVGTVILKRLDDAINDNDNILGTILGAATNHSADAISITHPHAQTQEDLYRRVLSQSGLEPTDVNVAEMHGTGTQAGDGAEMESISNVLAPEHKSRASDNPLYVGSAKANVGHGEAASGVTALIKSLLMFRKSLIPPHPGIKGLINQTFPDLDARNIRIAFSKTPFRAGKNDKRRLLVNNFSAAGGNTALLLEDFAAPVNIAPDPRTCFALTISAKAKASLQHNIENVISYLDENPDTPLADLSYTLTARRTHHDLRLGVSAKTTDQAKRLLRQSLAELPTAAASKPSGVAFAFTGQGSYYEGLGRDLYQTSSFFKSKIHEIDSLIQSHSLPTIVDFLEREQGSSPSPTQGQLLLVSIQLALSGLWASWGVSPDVVIGHSLGEYAALHAAGVVSTSDVVYLVGRRAQLLEERCQAGSHSMLAVRASVAIVQKTLVERRWRLDFACINGPNDVVLSGKSDEIAQAQEGLTALGQKCTRLDVPFAFHSPQIDTIRQPFEELGRNVVFRKPTIPVISPLLAQVIDEAGVFNSAYLSRHAREAVNFKDALQDAKDSGIVNDGVGWIEIGPHPVCLGMVKQVATSKFAIPSLRRNESSWETLSNSVKELYTQSLNLDWQAYHRDFSQSHRLLSLPAYAFDAKNYWLDYRNNWSLTKGQTGTLDQEEELVHFTPTTTLHRIVKEQFEDDFASVTFESNFSEPTLHAAVIGHLVNGSGLCPSSIYADMALTAAHYVHSRLYPDDASPGINVKAMEVSKPVIVSQTTTLEPHLLQVTATADVSAKKVDIEYNSIDNRNRSTISNAHCIAEYGVAEEWLSHWTRSAYLIESRIKALEAESLSGNVQRILRGMAYKLFSALVNYADAYRGMKEVLLLSSQRESTAKVEFQTSEKDGNFFFSPYWIDSLAHLSGFVLNANDAVDSRSHVFISHGWESMRFAVEFSAQKTYRTYVKMQPESKSTVMAGDVYVFEEDQVVGLIEGLKFQQVPRTVLDHLLPPAVKSPAVRQPARAVPPKTQVEAIGKTNQVISPAAVAEALDQNPTVSVVAKVAEIIAAEVGIAATEMTEEAAFAELGIDSLLSLTIAGRIKEDLDIPFAASLFAEYATLRALSAHLQQHEPKSQQLTRAEKSHAPTLAALAGTSPSDIPTLTTSSGSRSRSEGPSSPEEGSEATDAVKTIIVEEMGFDPQEVSSEAPLRDLGMDSLMSLTVLGVLREKTGLDIPQTLLADNPSIQDLENRLYPPPPSAIEVVDVKASEAEHSDNVAPYYPPASSILLQGSAKTSGRSLFLFPDGSGSATSYAAMPTLSPALAVYGLNSPFLKNPRDYTCGITGIAQIYITEIKRRQPHGPYTIGGWSVGGVIAYEAAYLLVQGGEQVDQLLMIDSPCPLLLPPLPVSLVRFFDSLGLFGQGESPPWLLEHFDSSVANLHRYKPIAIPPPKAPKAVVIWARDGVCGDPLAPRPGLRVEDSKSKSWILDNRNDFGPNSWDELVGAENISGVGVAGNHFTMMQEPNVAQLSHQIGYALSQR